MAKDKKPKEVIEEVKSTKEESTLYYFTSTGCAFCKQLDPIIEELNNGDYNILKLDLSEKDNEGLKKEVQKEYDIKCGTPLLVDVKDGNFVCGYREKDLIEKWAKGEKIPTPPKPKSPPPRPPFDFNNEIQVSSWKKQYKIWAKENKHLPNIPTTEDMLNRLKAQYNSRQSQNKINEKTTEQRISSLEKKIDKLMNHLGVR
tara:strand:- start:96 stop:698 length:603 start_codon:yes stop_codon:yes gene_type:complete